MSRSDGTGHALRLRVAHVRTTDAVPGPTIFTSICVDAEAEERKSSARWARPKARQEDHLMSSGLTRRALVGSSLAGAGLAASAQIGTTRARAAAPASRRQAAGIYRYKIGSYELTAVHEGTWYRPIDDK